MEEFIFNFKFELYHNLLCSFVGSLTCCSSRFHNDIHDPGKFLHTIIDKDKSQNIVIYYSAVHL